MKVRSHMLKRLKELMRDRKVVAIVPFGEKFDVELEGKTTVRLNAYELAAAAVEVPKP